MAQITDKESFEAWLRDKPRAWLAVLAFRIALNALPYHSPRLLPHLTSSIFRSLFISWAYLSFPHYDFQWASLEAARKTNENSQDATHGAFRSALYAVAAISDNSIYCPLFAADSAAHAAYEASSDIWARVSLDTNFFDKQGSVKLNFDGDLSSMAAYPLWLDPALMPNSFFAKLSNFRVEIFKQNNGSDFWLEWFLNRIDGKAHSFLGLNSRQDEKFIMQIVQETDTFWNQDFTIINRKLKNRLAAAREASKNELKNESLEQAITPDVNLNIPAQSSAAMRPIIEKGRLVLPKNLVATDIGDAVFKNRLKALNSQIRKLVASVRAESNIDHRAASALEELAQLIENGEPDQVTLFEFAHGLAFLNGFKDSVNEQWPDVLAQHYGAMLKNYDEAVKQVPEWRDMTHIANSPLEALTETQTKAVCVIVGPISQTLSDSAEFIAADIPIELNKLAKSENHFDLGVDTVANELAIGSDLLTYDLLESINNIFKSLAEESRPVLTDMAHSFTGAMKKQAVKESESLGKQLVQVLFALLKTGIGTVVGAVIGTTALGPYLVSQFPHQFAWLEPILRHMHLF